MKFYTIGVYESTAETFFGKLADNRIDMFLDIRLRRGVRGAKYAFVNSTRLQEKLAELEIGYLHIKALAPSKEIRQQQKQADENNRVLKSQRDELSECFVESYQQEIIKNFDFNELIKELQKQNAHNIVLFCVESRPKACHRSLVGDKLKEMGYQVAHL